MGSKIFKRKDRKSYYCKLNGKFVKLHANREKALGMWHRLCAEFDESPAAVPTVRTLLKSYFDWFKVNRAESTIVRREPVLKKFSQHYGKLKASAIRPHHVTTWVDELWGKCSTTTRRDHMTMIQAAFS
ncbi:MAG: N-terminal phage integrase SAM-like domain-containing protein [Pirellulales bacterium]|nr:N-terminal phage integrase SAM-like domain-containing protein [Pirellulales bacterium]